MRILMMVLMVCACPVPAWSETVLNSGPQRVHLLELYTSEGCNSCPPAEAYLSSLRDKPGLWTQFIPLAFHVDYWDYLGWRDVFSREDFSQRQRRYASVWRQHTVYTPGFVLDGVPWRIAARNRLPEFTRENPGELKLRIAEGRLTAGFTPVMAVSGNYELYLAVLGSGLASDIQRGENAGRKAIHDFLVLDMWRHVSATPHWQLSMPALPARAQSANSLALVAWVSREGDPRPLQAVGTGWLQQ